MPVCLQTGLPYARSYRVLFMKTCLITDYYYEKQPVNFAVDPTVDLSRGVFHSYNFPFLKVFPSIAVYPLLGLVSWNYDHLQSLAAAAPYKSKLHLPTTNNKNGQKANEQRKGNGRIFTKCYFIKHFKALRHGSHNFTCKLSLQYVCLSSVSVHQMAPPRQR